jgi:glutamate-ammonia-ligase adenylyltransferase
MRMINASGWAATFLTQHPILLDELLDDRGDAAAELPLVALAAQLDAAAGDTERQLDILREAHHAQLFRLLALDLAGELSVERLADHLSALADLIVAEVVRRAWLTIPSATARCRASPSSPTASWAARSSATCPTST